LPDSELRQDQKSKTSLQLKNEVIPPLESVDFSDSPTPEPVVREEASEVIPEKAKIPKRYYIIGGSFSVELNADKLVAVLRNKGYEAERSGLSRSGFHIVSYFSTEDKNEALINLDIIRRKDNPSAWLLRK